MSAARPPLRPPGLRVATILLALLALLGPVPAAAQGQGPAVARVRLANGLTVLARENPTAPVVAISLGVRMGTRWETRENAGISNLLQLMVVRGTARLDGGQIVEAADRMGGSIDAYGDVDFSEIAATALSRHWVEMLELVADIALRPTLHEGTTRAVRDFLLRQIRNRGDKPYDAGLDALSARLFGDHGYAWNPLGLRESVERLDQVTLRAHYRLHYVPGQMVLAVSGRVKAPEVAAHAERLFGGAQAAPAPPLSPAALPVPSGAREVLEVAGAQAQILAGGLAPALTDPDHAAVKVLSTVLGGGMAGRFFSELRDKQGLAYTTGILYPTRADRSYILAQIGTAPENLERSEAALLRELRRIQQEPVSEEELRVAKAYLLGNLAMDRRTNARQAWYLAAFETAGVGHEFLDGYVTAVRRVTPVDVQRVARRYLSTLRTVVVRPPAR
ncbi:MAG: insulinase family protein [Candidatus Rokubacteria bacterium]|nr:insulinase family protein [Candidatus Rokubacteria bacterium]